IALARRELGEECTTARRARQKRLQLVLEALPRRLRFEDKVIRAFEWHEASAGNAARQEAALLERHRGVVCRMEDEGRTLHLRQQRLDVDVVKHFQKTQRIGWRSRDALQLVEPALLLEGWIGKEDRCEELAKGWVLLAPSYCHHLLQHIRDLELLGGGAQQPAARIPA